MKREPADILEPGRVVVSAALALGGLFAPWVLVALVFGGRCVWGSP